KASTTITDITRNITRAIDQTDVKRLVVIATAGIHGELAGISGVIVNFLLKNTLKDHKGAFALIQTSSAAYTIARPVSLTDGEWTGMYREAETGVPNKGMRIARADVADFLVKVISDDHYIGQSIGLAD
ncbi:MAG: NAD(P)-dependent oxidoreductase, partial [Culicoidibacterales bacterium]